MHLNAKRRSISHHLTCSPSSGSDSQKDEVDADAVVITTTFKKQGSTGFQKSEKIKVKIFSL